MNELFNDIIIGEKKSTELKVFINDSNKDILKNNSYLYKWEQLSELFLINANKRYQDGMIKKEHINHLLEEYSNFISSNEDVKEYLLKAGNGSLELTLLNNVIVNMITQFISKMNELDDKRVEKLRREYGYIHPLLLSVITAGIGFITLGTIYLKI